MLRKGNLCVLVVLAIIFALAFGACGELGLEGLLDGDLSEGRVDLYSDYPPGATIGPGFYKVGEPGPAGGIIFYAPSEGFYVDGEVGRFFYLEAAPEDLPGGLYLWQSAENEIVSTGTAIGTGRRNTALIDDHADETPAASACIELRTGDRPDWFLPSIDELSELRNQWYNAENPDVYNFNIEVGSSRFWSSSQYAFISVIRTAMISCFASPLEPWNYNYKASETNFVRAIRAF